MNATDRRTYWKGYRAMKQLAQEYGSAEKAFTEIYQSNTSNMFVAGARRAYRAITSSPRHCYAVHYAYPNAISDRDTLARFNSLESRAQWLEDMESVEPGQWEPVTLAAVRHRFDVKDFGPAAPNYYQIYNQSGETIPYIYQRSTYQL